MSNNDDTLSRLAGAGMGAMQGAKAGALVGTLGGPVGTVLGAKVGGVAGAVRGALDPKGTMESAKRSHAVDKFLNGS